MAAGAKKFKGKRPKPSKTTQPRVSTKFQSPTLQMPGRGPGGPRGRNKNC